MILTYLPTVELDKIRHLADSPAKANSLLTVDSPLALPQIGLSLVYARVGKFWLIGQELRLNELKPLFNRIFSNL